MNENLDFVLHTYPVNTYTLTKGFFKWFTCLSIYPSIIYTGSLGSCSQSQLTSGKSAIYYRANTEGQTPIHTHTHDSSSIHWIIKGSWVPNKDSISYRKNDFIVQFYTEPLRVRVNSSYNIAFSLSQKCSK